MAESKTNTEAIRIGTNSLKYLNSVQDQHLSDADYIPESLQPYVNNYVRSGRKNFDLLSNSQNNFAKSSDEYISIQQGMEGIARGFIRLKDQIELYKSGIGKFKAMIPEINKGTKDENFYLNSAVYGNQWSDAAIDKDGSLYFNVKYGEGKQDFKGVRLDDISDFIAGSSPIITEPWTAKKYVFDLAEQTKRQKDANAPFDYDWILKSTISKLTDTGPQSIIGMAFTDMAGDGQTMSFAEMYRFGLRDSNFYLHPQTGQQLPRDTSWMKDQNNSEILAQLLSKYIADTMQDVYGTVDKKTGLVKKSKADLARELIEKYSNK